MTQRKAKRKLSDIDFSKEGSHIALVSKEQGHGANGHHYALVMKATNFSEEFLEKASKITVSMDIVEYLQRFFWLTENDSELLARSLGFTTPGMDKAVLEQAEQMLEDQETPEYDWEMAPGDTDFEKWINYKLQSIQVMKKLYEAENTTEALASLSEDEYLAFLKDQQLVEKSFKKIDEENVQKACGTKGKKPVKKSSVKESAAKAEDTSDNTIVHEVKSEEKSSVVKQVNKEKSMTEKTQVIEQEVEVIAKSQYDEIVKAQAVMQEQLQKALDQVKLYEAEKKEAIAKSRKETLDKACGKHAEVIFKAVAEADDAVFADVVKALSEMSELVEKSALFQEQGASVSDVETAEENKVASLLKSKYNKQ